MRIDITNERTLQVQSWNSITAYKKVSTKAVALLRALASGEELTRPDLFRAAGYEANRRTSGGQPKTDLTDYKLFMTGLLDMRATGIKGNNGYNGVKTYWRINDAGIAALAAQSDINEMWKHIWI